VDKFLEHSGSLQEVHLQTLQAISSRIAEPILLMEGPKVRLGEKELREVIEAKKALTTHEPERPQEG
jgi:hypothetical protein